MELTPAVKNQAEEEIEGAEIEVETPTIQQIQKANKPFSVSTNGVLKRKNHVLHQHQQQQQQHQHQPVVVVYRNCLKNHAANIGGHAVDGCGEFMPSSTVNPTDPSSLKCAACGCHRNFHRREPEEMVEQLQAPPTAVPAIEYKPHHRHHPPPPPPLLALPHGDCGSPDSSSPPPISSAFYPSSAPHMLMALSAGFSGEKNQNPVSAPAMNSNSRKRFRTKFTTDQKVKMQEFAEKVGWRMQKRDEDLVKKFCNEIGIEKGVLKVWMHNNKNNSVRKSEDHNNNNNNNNGNSTNSDTNGFCIVSRNNNSGNNNFENKKENLINHAVTANGSSPSS